MKYIVEYKLHTNGINKITPYFVEDGGYFPVSKKFIGVTFDTDEVYVPLNTLTQLTRANVVSRVISLALFDQDGNPLSEGEKTTLAETWCDDRGFTE